MLFRELLGADLSGSVGAVVASHNRGGPYFRVRAIPVNPGTLFQAQVRAAFGNLAQLWLNLLTPTQRTSWDTYALNVFIPNPLGAPRNIGGLGQYIRSNTPRIQAGHPRVDDAPTIFNLGDYTAPTINAITASTDLLSLNFTPADDWANEDDAGLLVYTARGNNQSINYFTGPYRFAASVDGDSVTPPTSPASIALAFGVAVDQRVFIRMNVTRADGRLGQELRLNALAV